MHEYARVLHGRGTIACKSENWEKCYHSGYLFFFFFFCDGFSRSAGVKLSIFSIFPL